MKPTVIGAAASSRPGVAAIMPMAAIKPPDPFSRSRRVRPSRLLMTRSLLRNATSEWPPAFGRRAACPFIRGVSRAAHDSANPHSVAHGRMHLVFMVRDAQPAHAGAQPLQHIFPRVAGVH